MISLRCPNCGFFFSVDFPDDITEEERKEIFTCPCGEMFWMADYIMIFVVVGERNERN